MKKLPAALAALFVVAPFNPAFAQDVIVNGDVLYFQDMKEFEPRVWKDSTEHGGIARLATVLNDLKETEDGAVVASGGDVASGTLFNSVYRGVPFVEAFNDLGVNVANFGNHDFDFGSAYTLDLVRKSNFPWITTNLTNPQGEPFSPGGTTAVINDGDLKIGFVALTAELQRTPAARDVIVQDFVASARAGVAELESENVDAIVLLSQISRAQTHEVMEAIQEIDAALREENGAQTPAEHSQTRDGRWILAPEADYGTVEHLDITKNRSTGAVTVTPTSIKVDSAVEEDEAWAAKSDSYYASLDKDLAAEVGTAEQSLSKADLGYLVADSYRSYFGTEIGLQNGGGQRAEIHQGPVTLRHLKSVLPFGNSVTAVKATGAEIRLLLEQGIQSNPNGEGGFPRTAGLSFEFDPDAEFGNRVTQITLESGEEFDDGAVYTLALSGFIAEGGDGMTAVQEAERLTNETIIDVDVFEKYVREQAVLKPYSPNTPEPDSDPAANGTTTSSSTSNAAVILAVLAGLVSLLGLIFSPQIDKVLGPIAKL